MEYDAFAAEALFADVFKSPLSGELYYRLDKALEVTDALWELVPVVAAAAERHEQRLPTLTADESPAAQRVPAERRAEVRLIADTLLEAEAVANSRPELDSALVAALTAREAAIDTFGVLHRLLDVSREPARYAALSGQLAHLSVDELNYWRVYARAKQQGERTPVLLRALFVTAVGTIEPLVARLVTLLLYYGRPGRYGSLTDTRLEVDARRLCFGPPGKWRESLINELGVTMLGAAVDWARLEALWEDRNVIAHRGSVTDLRHSAKTAIEAGSVLSPDVEAIRLALDVVGATRYALVACVWEHLEPGKGDYANNMSSFLLWDSLRTGRWEQAELLGRLELQLVTDPQDMAIAQVHRWLAIDMGHGPAEIQAEVEAWDVSTLPAVYSLARYVLLRQDDRAISMLAELLEAGEITQNETDTWPLFDRLRTDGRLGGTQPLGRPVKVGRSCRGGGKPGGVSRHPRR